MAAVNDVTARAALVHELDVIGEDPAERFDRVARLTRDVFGAPMAFVNLVDDNTLYTLTPQTSTGRRELPASESFCAETVLHDEPTVVSDARTDDRFATLPVVQTLGIRFYAGAPIKVRGTRVGSVCVMDTRPRVLADSDVILLQDLATWAGRILSDGGSATDSGTDASTLIPGPVQLPGYDLRAEVVPFSGASGDFYDWIPTTYGVAITLTDVMGKGMEAAKHAASIRAAFRAQDQERPATDVIGATDREIGPALVRADSFATAFHAHLDTATGWVDFGDAGHGIAMHLSAHGQAVRLLRSRDLPLGLHPGAMRRSSGFLVLQPGDALIVCSDGVLDLFDGTLASLDQLAEMYWAAPDDFLRRVRALIAERSPDDDVTTLVLARHGAAPTQDPSS
ncbi:serine phosphatase [Curtobacterium sp. MCBD17_023]|nr:serine phosphatase [Curtobacterium sp. MCBD17_023]